MYINSLQNFCAVPLKISSCAKLNDVKVNMISELKTNTARISAIMLYSCIFVIVISNFHWASV